MQGEQWYSIVTIKKAVHAEIHKVFPDDKYAYLLSLYLKTVHFISLNSARTAFKQILSLPMKFILLQYAVMEKEKIAPLIT